MVVKADFPFQSKYLDVDGSKIHYVEEGKVVPTPYYFCMVVQLPLIYGEKSYLL
jgi:hypothetical protein